MLTVTRYNPFRLARPRSWESLFEDFGSTTWQPALDMVETDDAVVVTMDVPGFDPEKIEVSIQDDVLEVKGEIREEKSEENAVAHRRERRYAAFRRAVRLPAPVSADKVDAQAKHGVLTIKLPKRDEAVSRRIKVKAS